MKRLGRKLAAAFAFAVVMTILAYFDGSILLEGASRPLWFQIVARLLIYMLIFFAVSLIVDAIFSRMEK